MIKLLIIVPILLTASTVHSRIDESKKGFIHLESLTSESSTQGLRSPSFEQNDYYVSVNPATWSNALADCRNVFGPNTTLVSIESTQEWEFLKDNLENYGGTTYWTSGIFDPSTSAWRWSFNNQPLPPFAPWATGFPNTPHGLLRVLLFFTNRFDASWHTVANTQTHRYICEIQRTTIAVPCYSSNDLAVVLDSSGSIGAANYELAKGFVDKLVRAFTVHKESRVAMITFASTATKIIDLANTLSPDEISSRILSIHFTGGGTATNLGIDMAVAQFQSSPRKVPMNMVVLTDGHSNSLAMTTASATRAKNLGVRSFSVGITPSINQAELLVIAGGDPNHVFTTANFDELIKLLAPLSLEVCPNVANSPSITEIPQSEIVDKYVFETLNNGVTETIDYKITEVPEELVITPL